jgi:hypothetical protein
LRVAPYDGYVLRRCKRLPISGSDWSDDYNRGMTFLVGAKLLGHEPADCILFPTERRCAEGCARRNRGVQSLRFDPNADVLSLIPGRPGEGRPYHEDGQVNMGPYEVTLNTLHPRAIWIIRSNYPKETLDNPDFVLALMKALHQPL